MTNYRPSRLILPRQKYRETARHNMGMTGDNHGKYRVTPVDIQGYYKVITKNCMKNTGEILMKYRKYSK